MNNKQIEALGHYKAMHPGALILFHTPGSYVALGEDARRVAELLPEYSSTEPDMAVVPDSIEVLSRLGDKGDEIVVVDYRNDSGTLDFPDTERLSKEKEMDI